MVFSKILKGLLLLLGGIFIVFQGMTFETEGAAISTIILILLILQYLVWTKRKNHYFTWFLILFTLGNIVGMVGTYFPDLHPNIGDIVYYGANILFILAYLSLTLKVVSQLALKTVFTKLSIPIFILLLLDIFCVSLVTATAVSSINFYDYALEYSYNAIVMILLSIALINYMYRNDTKSMMLLIGSMCIVFSEIIQLAYFYVIKEKTLGFVYSFLLVVAFIFFYIQSQQEFTGPEPEYEES